MNGFDWSNLAAIYDRGLLVPFIGSGMSRNACASWDGMISALEQRAGKSQGGSDLTARALFALERLRFLRRDVVEEVYEAIYAGCDEVVPAQSLALASLYWPLVCSTNYDDIYLRAVLQRGRPMPAVLGRSELDCRRVLQHLALPASEALWTLQGFLGWKRPEIEKALPSDFDRAGAAADLVVGHAEYRRAAHRSSHFRRCFAEVFRARSFLFLGSGLAEPYFRALFDEIIELVGPPVLPHFAIVEEGRLDTAFMQRQYHVLCLTYPRGQKQRLPELLDEFSAHVSGPRARASVFGYRVASTSSTTRELNGGHFNIMRGELPKPEQLGKHEVIAISCGRKGNFKQFGTRGIPAPSASGRKACGIEIKSPPPYSWLGDSAWIIELRNEQIYGIVARGLVDESGVVYSRGRRSPEAIRLAFLEFLREMESRNVKVAHVQLLSAGEKRVFHPWVSLVQMARAYGEWSQRSPRAHVNKDPRIKVHIYVLEQSVMTLLSGGHIDLSDQLQNAPMRLNIEIINEDGTTSRYHQIAKGDSTLAELIPQVAHPTDRPPAVYCVPSPVLGDQPKAFDEAMTETVRDFGIVAGSTLVVDFRGKK